MCVSVRPCGLALSGRVNTGCLRDARSRYWGRAFFCTLPERWPTTGPAHYWPTTGPLPVHYRLRAGPTTLSTIDIDAPAASRRLDCSMPTTDNLTLADRIQALTEEVIAGTDYFVVDVDVRGHKGTRVVEVFVDGDTDLGLDDLATVSKELGFLLDVEDVIDGSYKLEVSTPGIKRPLQQPRQYVKNVGRTLRVRHQLETDESEQNLVGDLTEADDDGFVLELPNGDTRRIPYEAVTQARIELPW